MGCKGQYLKGYITPSILAFHVKHLNLHLSINADNNDRHIQLIQVAKVDHYLMSYIIQFWWRINVSCGFSIWILRSFCLLSHEDWEVNIYAYYCEQSKTYFFSVTEISDSKIKSFKCKRKVCYLRRKIFSSNSAAKWLPDGRWVRPTQISQFRKTYRRKTRKQYAMQVSGKCVYFEYCKK